METRNRSINTIDRYIADSPAAVRGILRKVRIAIRKAAPQAAETISYRIPAFVFHGNLVHFAAFKRHIGFYPTPAAIRAFKNDLTGFTCSKGAVQFPIDKPVPYGLISRIVKYRIKESLQKASANKRI